MICSGFEGEGRLGKAIPPISSSAPLNFEALQEGFFLGYNDILLRLDDYESLYPL
jgi:hypothetical protein